MPEHVTPDVIRSREFTVTRRGYNRGEVDSFKDEVAAVVENLEARVSGVQESMRQLGITDLPEVKAEIDAVTYQVGNVLQQAREAAEQMRTRAADDAARWRAEADAEARAERESVDRDSRKARGDAWETATEMLDQVQEQQAEMLTTAEQDALFIRAEAEREALRMTVDARRDTEELVREARSEADRLLMAARSESDTILDQARQSAESAQERARALEQRRGELMGELEAARQSIGQLEEEIDSRRETLHAVATGQDPTMRVVEPTVIEEEWADRDPSVRIIPASRVPVDEPVDADALVAEVERLRSRVDGAEEVVSAPELEAPVDEPADAGPDAAVEPAVEPELEPEPEQEREPESLPEAVAPKLEDHEIDDLFAKLRATPEAPVPETTSEPEVLPADDAASSASASVIADSTPVVDHARPATEVDPFDLRDRHLLPITNRTLRTIKREIVELQNRVLEELRISKGEWHPDSALFAAALSDEIARLVQESFVAGHAGAAELLGLPATPQPEGAPPAPWPAIIIEAFGEAVATSLRRAYASGAGSRQVSAAVSKVFRAWRTDGAERRLRQAARATYHAGLLEALPRLGVERVMAVAPGRPCDECAAGSGLMWVPGESPPGDLAIPPAGAACDATVVPAAFGS